MAKILIADDDRFFRKLITKYLTSIGHDTLEAQCGQEAKELIDQNQIDIILIDYMMPQGDGPSIIRFVKQSSKTSSIPMIMITSRLSGDDKVFAFDAGVDDYMVKPIHIGELTSRINKLLSWKKVA